MQISGATLFVLRFLQSFIFWFTGSWVLTLLSFSHQFCSTERVEMQDAMEQLSVTALCIFSGFTWTLFALLPIVINGCGKKVSSFCYYLRLRTFRRQLQQLEPLTTPPS
jgi:hypothetical protein